MHIATQFAAQWPTSNKRGAVFGALLAASFGVAGCESGSSMFGNTAGTQPETQVTQTAPVAQRRVTVAPVIGAPDGVAKQLQADVSSAIAQKSVTVVGVQEKADYALRGYVVAAKDKGGTKVSYIWDVTDQAGRRVNRITGEEIVAGAGGADAWSSVTPQISQTIAQKSAGSFASWMQQANANVASSQLVGTPPTGVGAAAQTPVASLPGNSAAIRPAAAQTGPVAAVVPSLVGAPGDGNSALSKALQSELNKNGVAPGAQNAASSYRVDGVVRLGSVADGKQSVQIDWNVKDPQGKRLGTVTQRNEIPAGSLDSTWGRTADAAAAAAAQGILKLLPKNGAN